MKRFISAIALPLGISIILPVATGMLWPFVLFKALGPQGVLENRERLASVWLAARIVQGIVAVWLGGWAGWRARRAGASAAPAGATVLAGSGLFEEAARIAVSGHFSVPWLVWASALRAGVGAVLGGIGGLLVARFHPELRARPVVPLVKVKHFPSRMIAEMASETLEHEGIPSSVVEASGWPFPQGADLRGADLYVAADDAARVQEIISALFGDA